MNQFVFFSCYYTSSEHKERSPCRIQQWLPRGAHDSLMVIHKQRWLRFLGLLRRHQVSKCIVEGLSRVLGGWRPVCLEEETSLRIAELEEGLGWILGLRREVIVRDLRGELIVLRRLVKRVKRRRLIVRVKRGRLIVRVMRGRLMRMMRGRLVMSMKRRGILVMRKLAMSVVRGRLMVRTRRGVRRVMGDGVREMRRRLAMVVRMR